MSVYRHSEALEEMFISHRLYGDCGIWARPKDMFIETVTIDGKQRSRLEFIRELDLEPPKFR